MKILLVDDDYANTTYVQVGLEDYHYIIDTALDGNTGLKMAIDNNYDAIVLEIMLPGISGFDICEEICNHVNVPIIMLTSLNSMEDRVKAFHCGADDYLDKPYLIEDLHHRIMTLTSSKRALESRQF
jgi:two-component system, OmpR family, copper resistance phosphate regulon response regulator CusR